MTTIGAKRATVLVLGDLGRSPRMLNHARSLSLHGWDVELIGLPGAALPADIRESPRIRPRYLDDSATGEEPPRAAGPAYALRAGARAAALAVRLACLLPPFSRRPTLVLAQNPPGIPTLPLAWLLARLSSARLVVDWHNLTSSMLALRVGRTHPLVSAAGWVECAIGRRADVNLFVSQAMADHLALSGLCGEVFRDRPGHGFIPIDSEARSRFRAHLLEELGIEGDESGWALALSPTSWTADEDFDLLLEALGEAELSLAAQPPSRRLLVVASGRGASRIRFERNLSTLGLNHIVVKTTWFEPEAYRLAVASADVGLCLHRSASGLDLPMKLMDFFGAGVPVLALDYSPCLSEAVRHGESGLLFPDASSLAAVLVNLLADGSTALNRLRPGAEAAGRLRWDEGWRKIVLPLLDGPT